MWYTKLWLVVFLPGCMGFDRDTVEFSANYFKERNVPFVCLISCRNGTWAVEFTKAASARHMSVSHLNTNHLLYESVKHCLYRRFTGMGVLVDAHCRDADQILYTASENRWLALTHMWLIIDETTYLNTHTNTSAEDISAKNVEYSSKTLQTLSYLNISVDADIIIASPYDNQFKLFDVFNFGKEQGGSIIVTEIGTWNVGEENKELLQKLNTCKYYRRWDFKQGHMRIISVAVATSLYFREQDLTSVFRYLESLFDRVTLIHPALSSIETRFIYRIPTTGAGKFENQFLRPLSAGTWYSLLLVSVMCTIIMLCASRLEARPLSFQYAFFSVIASVCQQCFEDDTYDLSVRRISGARKLTMFVTGIACVLIYNYYTSSVVSWLLNGPPPSINSLKELLESPFELIFEDAGYTHSWLTVSGYYFNSANSKYEDIMKRRVLSKSRRTPLFVPIEQGIAMVKAGGYAYLTEPFNANNLISATFDQGELCELDSLPSIVKVKVYPGVQKDSPYKEFLTWSLTRLLERGIVSCIQRRTAPLPVACEGSSPRALALGGAAPAFILLGVGYITAVVILYLERFVYKMKQRYD